MRPAERRRRHIAMVFWRVFNPLNRPLAGIAPWWVLLETTGRRTGKPRRVPLAKGPVEEEAVWLISVHGSHASFARNIEENPKVRLRVGGRWREGRAEVLPMDAEMLRQFNLYARSGPRTIGIEPKLVRVDLG